MSRPTSTFGALLDVTLTHDQVALVTNLGLTRRAESAHLEDKHGFDGTNASFIDINGAAGELALAIALGVTFDAHVNVFKVPDVFGLHVRTTVSHGNSLIIRDGDPEGNYVLVTGSCPKMRVHGGIHSSIARKMDRYRRAPNGREPAWFIPQKELSTFDQLKAFVESRKEC